MKNKKVGYLIGVVLLFVVFVSCEKERIESPNISFKTSSGYLHISDTLSADSLIKIGIEATKAGTNGELRIFNISKSINDSTLVRVYSKGLSGTSSDSYNYDFSAIVDSIPGTKCKYLFSVTNMNDITSSVSLTVYTQ
jgi:hypothetical protein